MIAYPKPQSLADLPVPPVEALRDLNIEEWRPVVGFPRYKISSFGKVIGPRGKQRKVQLNNAGYRQLHLFENGRQVVLFVHQQVLIAFVGPRPEGCIARHLDGNRENNCRWNLAWGTPKENAQDAIRHGVFSGKHVGRPKKLTPIQRQEICASTERASELARKYRISRATVYNICKESIQ